MNGCSTHSTYCQNHIFGIVENFPSTVRKKEEKEWKMKENKSSCQNWEYLKNLDLLNQIEIFGHLFFGSSGFGLMSLSVSFLTSSILLFPFVMPKDVKMPKNYSDQPPTCEAPICWQKYTTRSNKKNKVKLTDTFYLFTFYYNKYFITIIKGVFYFLFQSCKWDLRIIQKMMISMSLTNNLQ